MNNNFQRAPLQMLQWGLRQIVRWGLWKSTPAGLCQKPIWWLHNKLTKPITPNTKPRIHWDFLEAKYGTILCRFKAKACPKFPLGLDLFAKHQAYWKHWWWSLMTVRSLHRPQIGATLCRSKAKSCPRLPLALDLSNKDRQSCVVKWTNLISPYESLSW